ncbi:MAG: tetratricopeptide repeat protein [Acidobacteriaceae bacterium]
MRPWSRYPFLLFSLSLLAAQSTPAPAPAAGGSLAQAQQALDHDHVDDALAILKQMPPSAKGVQHALGLAWYRTGKLVEARDAFNAAIQQDPQDVESVQMEGLTLYRLGQPAAAIPFLERVRQWTPNAGTDANYVLGLCYLNANRYDDARKAFAAQFGEDPNSGSAWLLLATMLQHDNLPRQAAVEAQKALDADPQLPLAHFLLGQVALLDSNIDLALKEFQAEQRINPGYAAVYERLGDAYLRTSQLDLAQQSLTKALSLDMSSTGPFILMGRVLLRRQDARTAIMYLQHAEKMDPANYVTHASLAQAYRMSGQEDEAKRENELAAKSHLGNESGLGPMQ